MKRRIIPCVDVRAGRMAQVARSAGLSDPGDPLEHAATYEALGADELAIFDLTPPHAGRAALLDLVERFADRLSIPFTVGEVYGIGDARALFDRGADKVAVGAAAVADPALVARLAKWFGVERIMIAVTARRKASPSGLRWEIVNRGGWTPRGLDAGSWCKRVVASGAAEVLLHCMDREGTQQGYDLELIASVSKSILAPVIACGGAGEVVHVIEALKAGAGAALASTMFQEHEQGVAEVRAACVDAGLPMAKT